MVCGSGLTRYNGSEAGSYLRLNDFVYHSTLGLRAIKKKKGADQVAEAEGRVRLGAERHACLEWGVQGLGCRGQSQH